MIDRKAIAEQWLARLLASYPEQTASFLCSDADRFRNPVGYVFHEALSTLVDEVYGAMEPNIVDAALDSIIRIRAVQDFTPGQAIDFVFTLKDILDADSEALSPETQRRIEQLAQVAVERYNGCREQIARIRAKEAVRSVVHV